MSAVSDVALLFSSIMLDLAVVERSVVPFGILIASMLRLDVGDDDRRAERSIACAAHI